jgi:hypothetical protein
MSSIFANENAESPIVLVKATLKVKPDDNGSIMATFTTNKGKGSGMQIMPYGEYRAAIGVLVDAATNGIPEFAEEGNIPADEMVRRTLTVEDGIVSFRVKSGKGAKPARIPLADFKAVVDLLASGCDGVEAAGAEFLAEAAAVNKKKK